MNKRDQSSVWRSSVTRHADRLVEELSAMCERASIRGSSELVELNRALIRAARIRRWLRNRSGKQKFWETLRRLFRVLVIAYDVCLFVKDVATKIHSLLSNCNHIISCSMSPSSMPASSDPLKCAN